MNTYVCIYIFQFMLGSAILVKPVIASGQWSTKVYLPSGRWYLNFYNYMGVTDTSYENVRSFVSDGNMYVDIQTPLSVTPVFLLGGSIVPTKMRLRRSSAAMRTDPYTLIIGLNEKYEV